jgi:hypothetical protein
MTTIRISKTAEQRGFGTDMFKSVVLMTADERKFVKSGGSLFFKGFALSGGNHGTPWRKVLHSRGYFMPRVPDSLEIEKLNEIERREANRIARAAGYGRATTILHGTGSRGVVSHVDYGYRKNTTGEYVPHAYRAKFGWKNTYYQPALTTVALD